VLGRFSFSEDQTLDNSGVGDLQAALSPGEQVLTGCVGQKKSNGDKEEWRTMEVCLQGWVGMISIMELIQHIDNELVPWLIKLLRAA